MTPVEVCRLLLMGSVAAAEVPELRDEEVQAEVRRRLAEVGCELTYARSFERWVARLAGPVPALEDHDTTVRLNVADLAVLAACWLHLRFLPGERIRLPVSDDEHLIALDEQEPSLDPDDLARQFDGQLQKSYVQKTALGNLKRAGFLVQRDGRLFAGPLLDTIDEVTAAERARILLARHQRIAYLKRRAIELDNKATGDGSSRSSMTWSESGDAET
jgi:hypothetical protein